MNNYNEIRMRPYELTQRREENKRDYSNAHRADCLEHRHKQTNRRSEGLTEDERTEIVLYAVAFFFVMAFVYVLCYAALVWVRDGGWF